MTAALRPYGSATPFITRTGFYSPVSTVPGFVKSIKGGSTVPLTFNVYLNGVEKTDTAGLQFGVASVACSTAVAEDQVDWVPNDATSLRYDTTERQFIQDWKTQKAGAATSRGSQRPTASRSVRISR